MKGKLVVLVFLALTGCGKPNVFILADSGNDKYYLSDSVKKAFKKRYIGKSPLIAIDGVPFDYRRGLDTVILPLKKNEIRAVEFLNNESSLVIYGANAENGAVIINTTSLRKYNSDTVRTNDVAK